MTFLSDEYLTITNSQEKKALFNSNGKQLSDFKYNSIGYNPRSKIFIYNSEEGIQMGAGNKMFNNAESYDNIVFISNNLLRVRKGKSWGLIKASGEVILNCYYHAFVGDSLDMKAYSEKGVVLLSFDEFGAVKEKRTFKNFAQIQLSMRNIAVPSLWTSGNAQPPRCLNPTPFGWFTARKGTNYYYGLVDTVTKDTLIKPKYHSVCVCDSSGLTKVGFDKKKKDGVKFMNQKMVRYTVYGLVDGRGKRLLPLRFQSMDEQSLRDSSFRYVRTVSEKSPSSVTLVRPGDRSYKKLYRFVDRNYQGLSRATKTGYFVAKPLNQDLLGWNDYFLRTFSASNDNSFRSRMGAKGVSINKSEWGFINKSGDEVIPFEYQYVTNFKRGISFVKKDGKWGAIDTTGAVVIP